MKVLLTFERRRAVSAAERGYYRRRGRTVNNNTERKSREFDSRKEAMEWIEKSGQAGVTYSIWCNPMEYHVQVERSVVAGGTDE